MILHNASICATQPLWYEPIYNVTKSALMMFSKTLANEVVKDNIRVNTINAGLVLTPDWIKTAKQLTADKGGDWEGYLAGRRATSMRRSTGSARRRSWRTSSSSSAPTAPAIRSARPISSTAAC